MRIESISIHNLRQLKNLTIRFPKAGNDHDLHIILAENGVGKTNILNAITWCLYDKEMHLRDKNNALEIINSQVVDEARKWNNETEDVSVELVISTDETNRISFKRENKFNITQDAIVNISNKMTVSYYEHGGIRIVENEDDITQIIHKYLPEGINNYIFFDGEQLEKFFSVDQLNNVKKGINELTQASYLKQTYEYLERYIKEQINPRISSGGDKAITEAQNRINEYDHQIELSEQTIQKYQEQLNDAKERIDELNNKIHGFENIREKMQELQKSEKILNDLNDTLKDKKQEFMKFTREYFTLFSMYPAILKFHNYIEDQKKQGNLPPQIDKEILDRIIVSKKCLICGHDHLDDTHIEFVRKIKETLALASETSNELSSVYGAMSQYFDKIKAYDLKKDVFVKEISRINENIENEENTYKQLDSYLRSVPDNQEIADALDKRDYYRGLRDSLTGKIAIEKDNMQRNIKEREETNKKLRALIDKNNELMEYVAKRDFCEKCIRILREIEKEVLDECRNDIQNETFRIFSNLIWKHDAFSKVEILEDYSFRLLDIYGYQTLGSCSAAETALLALSFTLALQEVSKHDALLFIDTPIGRVGVENRKNFMNTLLEVSKGKQVILTFTPTEYDDNVRSILASNYNSFYSLIMKDGITEIKSK